MKKEETESLPAGTQTEDILKGKCDATVITCTYCSNYLQTLQDYQCTQGLRCE